MGQSERRNKSQKLTSWLAQNSPVRLQGNCPICHRTQALRHLVQDIYTCKGAGRHK